MERDQRGKGDKFSRGLAERVGVVLCVCRRSRRGWRLEVYGMLGTGFGTEVEVEVVLYGSVDRFS